MNEGWKKKKLGDVCELLNRGISPKYLEEGGVRVLNQKCIRNHQINFEPSRRHDLSSKKVDDNRFIKLGDVLVNSTGTGTLGRVAQVREEPIELTTVDSHVTIVRPKKAMFHLDFFGYLLVLIEDAIKEAGEGCGGQTELARSVLAEKFFVRFPEQLYEQKRIVDFLDESLKDIAKAKANTEKNLKNARAIFQSHLNTVFFQNNKNWTENRLQKLTSKIGSGATPRGGQESYKSEGIALIRSLNVHDMSLRFDNLAFIDDAQANRLANVEVQEGDILLNITGASIARCCIAPQKILPARVNQHVSIIRPNGDILNNRFLHYLLISKPYKGQLLQTGEEGGSTRQAITKAQIQGFIIYYPKCLKEQRSIVSKLDALLAEIQCLESIYLQKLEALDELKKSLLHHAFSGNLKGCL